MDDKKIRIEALKIAAMYAPYDGNYITGKEVHKPLSHTSREEFFKLADEVIRYINK